MSLFYFGPIAVGNLMVWWSELCHTTSISSMNSFKALDERLPRTRVCAHLGCRTISSGSPRRQNGKWNYRGPSGTRAAFACQTTQIARHQVTCIMCALEPVPVVVLNTEAVSDARKPQWLARPDNSFGHCDIFRDNEEGLLRGQVTS